MADDPLNRAKEALARAAAEAAGRQALDQAGKAVARAADSFADALEVALLGKKGAADEINARPEVDALDRLRAAFDAPPATPKPADPSAAAKLANAKAQLEAMKKARR